jgi:mono/diheme cytochrome c family protein
MRWLILAVVAIAAPAQAAGPQAASEARGRGLAERNCSMCHAIGRVGASPNAAAPPFRELGRRYGVDDLAEALSEGIITGHPAMPEFRFSPAEVNDLILYLRSVQTREAASAESPAMR